jgi:Tfp pilus assembly protein PilX
MRQTRHEEGFALVSAVILLSVIMSLGLGLLMFTDNQQKASTREQQNEAAFTLAEAALNAQIGQLSHSWPTATATYPSVCTEALSATAGCPSATSLSNSYPNTNAIPCAANAAKDAWGSALTNKWTTYVRDDMTGSVFNSKTEAEATTPSYDANGDGKVWVRSVGVVQCHVVSVITLVSRQLIALNFPHDAASGNWFKVTNSGKKVIVNTEGVEPYKAAEPGEISMRCEGVGTGKCEEWSEAKEQIRPNTTKSPALPSPLLSEEQVLGLKSEAIAAGTFRSPTVKGCPASLTEATGMPAYIEGCGNLKLTGGVANSSTTPGFLVLADGTLELLGNGEFFGVVYARNPSNSNGAVVSLGGTSQVTGAIDVDGRGGIEFGSSGANLVYDSRSITGIKDYAGATPTRNTFRILPAGQ